MPKEMDLLSKVQSAVNVLKVAFLEEHPSRDGGVDRFYAMLIKVSDDVARYESFCIRVYNKETESEEAYFRDSTPSPLIAAAAPSTFPEDLKKYLETAKTKIANTVKISIETMDIEQEFAIVNVWILSQDNVSARKYLVYKDAQGNFTVKPIA
ncbi:MAG: hypothetical protein QXX51_03890 [Candidatus Bathyarchaeia archaeon]